MPVFTTTVILKTRGFCDLHNITTITQAAVNKAGIKNGLACAIVTGSTAAITTIEYEPNLVKDFCELIEKLIPQNLPTRHGRTWGDDNGFSHLRASLIGPSLTIPIVNGRLTLGRWQQIVVCDFDNRPRERKIIIQINGD